jgi:hypothetical protein
MGDLLTCITRNFTTYADIILLRYELMIGWTDKNHPGFSWKLSGKPPHGKLKIWEGNKKKNLMTETAL